LARQEAVLITLAVEGFVRLSRQLTAATTAGGFAAERPVGRWLRALAVSSNGAAARRSALDKCR